MPAQLPIILVLKGVPDYFAGYSASHATSDVETSPYGVSGPKKAWFLMRNVPDPSLLFPCSDDLSTKEPKIKGYAWFREVITPNAIELHAVK